MQEEVIGLVFECFDVLRRLKLEEFLKGKEFFIEGDSKIVMLFNDRDNAFKFGVYVKKNFPEKITFYVEDYNYILEEEDDRVEGSEEDI